MQYKVDIGPELISKALDAWGYGHRLGLRLFELGKPQQNASIESFNGNFGDELLNVH